MHEAVTVPAEYVMRFDITHRGFDSKASVRTRRDFVVHATTLMHAAAWRARWPHRPQHGPSRVRQGRVVIHLPQALKSHPFNSSHPTVFAILQILQLCVDEVTKLDIVAVPRSRIVSVELHALKIEPVADPATRAHEAAKIEVVQNRPALRPGEMSPADEYMRIGLRVAPQEDWVERQVEAAERKEAREQSDDADKVTDKTLQRDEPLDPSQRKSSSKGRRRTSQGPPTAASLAEQFDKQTRDLEMLHLSDLDRAKEALTLNAKRIERKSRIGRPLKGSSPRIRIRERVPADLLVACSTLGPNLESILVATAKAIVSGKPFERSRGE